MERVISFLAVLIITVSTNAQVPAKLGYQAVVRDAVGKLVQDSRVTMRISILQGSHEGQAVYSETHDVNSNSNGLVTIEIGGGQSTNGIFSNIDWSSGIYFIKTETDPAGGSSYTIMGTSQLISVPYAFHAKTVESISETDPVYSVSQAANINATDITNLGNLSGTNSGDQDLSVLTTNQDLWDTAASIRSDIPDITGFISSETDPVYNVSQAANISETDITNLGNLSGINTGDQDLSDLALKSNVLELNNTEAFTPDADYEPATKKYVDDNMANETTFSVGDFALGGIIFWLDETGQHGLVCAKENQSTGIRWDAGTWGYTHAGGNGPYSGEANTSIIIAAQVAIGDDGSTYAARLCNELQITEGGNTYGDWYLPSVGELILIFENIALIDATAVANSGTPTYGHTYWSSTEVGNAVAYIVSFGQGVEVRNDCTKDWSNYVRAIRAF